MEKQQKIDFGKKAILVSRVSTPEQCLSEDLMPQLKDLEKWAEGMGYNEFYPIGTTESGFLKEDDKQGWNLVVDILKKDPSCKVVICTEISRLSRLEPILIYIRDYLCEHKIQLLIKDIGFSLLDEYGNADAGKKLIFSLFASLASSEMATKKERFKRALKEYRRLGYSIGGKELFGYTRVYNNDLGGNKKRSVYVINEIEAEEIRTIFKWYAYGIDGDMHKSSIFRITRECIARGMSKYLHSRRNVNKCLKEEAYTGFKKTKNKKKNPEYWNYKQLDKPKYIECEEYECKYYQIVEPSLFNEVQELMKKRNSHNVLDNDNYVDKSNKHTTILSKLLVCPCCGKFLVGEYRIHNSIIKHTYRCAYSRGTIHICSYKTSPSMVLLDSAIWAFAKSTIKFIVSQKNILSTQQSVDDLKLSIARLEEKINGYEDEIDIASFVYSNKMRLSNSEERKQKAQLEYEQKLKTIEREKKAYEMDIIDKKRQLHNIEKQNKSLSEFVDKDVSFIENNKSEMYNYIHLLIKSITPIYNDRQYTCLKIETFKGQGNMEHFIDLKKNNLEEGRLKTDYDYLLINKKDTNRIKMRVVSGLFKWDSKINFLKKDITDNLRDYKNKIKEIWGDKELEDDDIELEDDDIELEDDDIELEDDELDELVEEMEIPEMSFDDFFSKDFESPSSVHVENLEFNRLRFYDEDKINK